MYLHHLTNDELIAQLSLRDDLTAVEHDLLNRLIRAQAALHDLSTDAAKVLK